MGEKSIIIEDINPVDFFGANNAHLDQLKILFPKLKIVARGDVLKLIGDDNEIEQFEQKLNLLLMHYEKFGKITKHDITQLIQAEDYEENEILFEKSDIILHGRNGKPIKARTYNQQLIIDGCQNNDLVFAVGPAGTGKTYVAVALAVRALKEKSVKRIILTRPAVEAGENLGFLPGDLRDKLDPYLQPLYDALRDMLPQQKLLNYFEDGTIEIAPLAFMRGRTLANAFVILDEAQNATENQMKMFITRMGQNAKFFVTGDITQIDLPKRQRSGLRQAQQLLSNIKGVQFVYLDTKDVVRHQLVSAIITAYEKEENRKAEKQNEEENNNR